MVRLLHIVKGMLVTRNRFAPSVSEIYKPEDSSQLTISNQYPIVPVEAIDSIDGVIDVEFEEVGSPTPASTTVGTGDFESKFVRGQSAYSKFQDLTSYDKAAEFMSQKGVRERNLYTDDNKDKYIGEILGNRRKDIFVG